MSSFHAPSGPPPNPSPLVAPGDWPFTLVRDQSDRTKATGKTNPADRRTWTGLMAGRALTLVTMPRSRDAHAHFHVPANARIRGDHSEAFAQFVDVAVRVTAGEALTDQLLFAIARLAQAQDTRPVRARAHDAPVRTGMDAEGRRHD